jgi:hypothetical protein
MEKYINMRIIKTLILITLLLTIFFISPADAEKISLKFSLATNSIGEGDINPWIADQNQQWRDWQQANGGTLSGEFMPLSYGSNFEIELRIPIFAGFAINLGGRTKIMDTQSGQISYNDATGIQQESQTISNEVQALPLKIGLSFVYQIPLLENLYVFLNAGRHIIFVRYKTSEEYNAHLTYFDKEFIYQINKSNNFRSEALGFYASMGVEYDLIKYIAVVVEAEKTWSHVSGFKGDHQRSYFESINGVVATNEENGKASLYYYEKTVGDLSSYYAVLSGHRETSEELEFRNIRPGELNFDGFSIKFGIRFKF